MTPKMPISSHGEKCHCFLYAKIVRFGKENPINIGKLLETIGNRLWKRKTLIEWMDRRRIFILDWSCQIGHVRLVV